MTIDQSIAFLIFAAVAAITPGPSNLMLTATGARVGVRRGVPCLLGVGLGMGLLMFAVALGLGGAVLGRPGLLRGLNLAGAALLLWLAWRIGSTEGGTDAGAVAARPVGFVGAALFQWVNPKSWIVSASATAAHLHATADDAARQAAGLALLFVAVAMPSGLVWLAFGAGMQRALRTPRAARRFNLAMGLGLAASVAMLFW